MALLFFIRFWVGLETWDFRNIGKRPILRTWELQNIGKQAILRTLDPGNTGSQAILGTLDPGNTGSQVISAPFWLQHLEKNPFWELVPGKMNMGILEFSSKQALFWKWLPRANHYAHETRIEILSKTPVSILRDLSPRPQNHRETSEYSFLAIMSAWTFGVCPFHICVILSNRFAQSAGPVLQF